MTKIKSKITSKEVHLSQKEITHFKFFFYLYVSLLILFILSPLILGFSIFISDILIIIGNFVLFIYLFILPISFLIYLYKFNLKKKLPKDLKIIKIFLWIQIFLIFIIFINYSLGFAKIPIVTFIIPIIIPVILVKVINSNNLKVKWIKTKEGKMLLLLLLFYILFNILTFILIALFLI